MTRTRNRSRNISPYFWSLSKASGDVFYAVPLSLSPPSSRNWLEMEVKTSCESWVSLGRDKRRRIKLSDVYCRLTRTRSIGSLYRAQAVKTWPLTLRFSIGPPRFHAGATSMCAYRDSLSRSPCSALCRDKRRGSSRAWVKLSKHPRNFRGLSRLERQVCTLRPSSIGTR